MASTINASTAAGGGIISSADSSGILQLQTAGTAAVTVDASQNVGIGTSSPNAKLQVSGLATVGGASGGGIGVDGDSSTFTPSGSSKVIPNYGFGGLGGGIIGAAGYYGLTYYTAQTERMRIDSSGNVGIGTSSPSNRLTVANASSYCNIDLTPASGYNGGLNVKPGGTTLAAIGTLGNYTGGSATDAAIYAGNSLAFLSGGANERMRIDSSGNVLVGTTTAAGSGLTVGTGILWCVGSYNNTTASAANMNIGSTGGITRSTSALKYKQNVRDLPSIDINKFRPVVYNSKCENDDHSIDYFGFIADEVDAAGIKELVTYGADGEVEGFQYERLTAVLVKAIQELKAIVDAQAEQIKALESK